MKRPPRYKNPLLRYIYEKEQLNTPTKLKKRKNGHRWRRKIAEAFRFVPNNFWKFIVIVIYTCSMCTCFFTSFYAFRHKKYSAFPIIVAIYLKRLIKNQKSQKILKTSILGFSAFFMFFFRDFQVFFPFRVF